MDTLRRDYGTAAVAAYHAAAGERQSALRNSIVLGQVYAIDKAYGDYERELTIERRHLPFAGRLAGIALGAAGATVGDPATASLLAAIDAGLESAGEAYGNRILGDHTIETLQQAMRSDRNRIRARIIDNLSLSAAEYPLELALGDVEAYYNAGTLSGAMLAMRQTSAAELADSRIRLASSSVIYNYGTDASAERLRAYWRDGGAAAENAIREWMRTRGIAASLTVFLNTAEFAAARHEMARQFETEGRL